MFTSLLSLTLTANRPKHTGRLSTAWSQVETFITNGSINRYSEQDSDTLLNYPIYLEVQLDANTPMSPRQAINSAPYAQIVGIAESVEGGSVDADTSLSKVLPLSTTPERGSVSPSLHCGPTYRVFHPVLQTM